MSKKYESGNVSELEEHISEKYEIKRRLGKGVSVFDDDDDDDDYYYYYYWSIHKLFSLSFTSTV